jgi:hypothetical protein
MDKLAPYRTGDFYSSPFGSARVATSDEQSAAVAFERQCAKGLLPSFFDTLAIFLGSTVCFATGYGLFAFTFLLLPS